MSAGRENQAKFKPRIRKGIKLDKVNPKDFRELNLIYHCEQCSFHIPGSLVCSMGVYSKKHEKTAQLKLYYRTGMMAICRFLEID